MGVGWGAEPAEEGKGVVIGEIPVSPQSLLQSAWGKGTYLVGS